jgi:hypothetical protein
VKAFLSDVTAKLRAVNDELLQIIHRTCVIKFLFPVFDFFFNFHLLCESTKGTSIVITFSVDVLGNKKEIFSHYSMHEHDFNEIHCSSFFFSVFISSPTVFLISKSCEDLNTFRNGICAAL